MFPPKLKESSKSLTLVRKVAGSLGNLLTTGNLQLWDCPLKQVPKAVRWWQPRANGMGNITHSWLAGNLRRQGGKGVGHGGSAGAEARGVQMPPGAAENGMYSAPDGCHGIWSGSTAQRQWPWHEDP